MPKVFKEQEKWWIGMGVGAQPNQGRKEKNGFLALCLWVCGCDMNESLLLNKPNSWSGTKTHYHQSSTKLLQMRQRQEWDKDHTHLVF